MTTPARQPASIDAGPGAGWFRHSYGRLVVTGTPAGPLDTDQELMRSQLDSVLRRGLVATVGDAQRVAVERLKDPSEHPDPAVPSHPHPPGGCLECACAPYLGNGRKHAVEMAVLSNILVDQRRQYEHRVLDVPGYLLRDRLMSYEIGESNLAALLGPNWVRVLLLAFVVEETRPATLIRTAMSVGGHPGTPTPHPDGRDYTNAARTLVHRAARTPYEINPELLHAVPERHRSALAERTRRESLVAARSWAPVAESASAGVDVSPWEGALVAGSRV